MKMQLRNVCICLKKKKEYHRVILNNLKNYRNSTVHAAATCIEMDWYLQQLKEYVEILLRFHIFNRYKFASFQEAIEFLNQTTDLNELKKRQKNNSRALKYLTS